MEMPMINIRARREGARLLTEFFHGRITNDDYNDAFPSDSADAGLSVVYRRVWVYYSDLHSHYLDRNELSEEDLALFQRCIDFLQTDLEYTGPSIAMHKAFARKVRNLLGRDEQPVTVLGAATTEASGFFTPWWPFASALEYEQVKRGRV